MNISYKNFRIYSFKTYKTFNCTTANLIHKLCSSPIFPSSIIITGTIGAGKSTFIDVLTNYYYQTQPELQKLLTAYIDTPVDNSSQYCREILQRAIKISRIYNKRFFIIFDEAHILSFTAQQVFLSSIEREYNLTICFITNDYTKMCSAIQNRSLFINIEPFKSKTQIHSFAHFVYQNIEDQYKTSIEHNYNKLLKLDIHEISGRDIINAILYGDFSLYNDVSNLTTTHEIEKYVNTATKSGIKIVISNIMHTIATLILQKQCTCTKLQNTKRSKCETCYQMSMYLTYSTYVINTNGLKMILKLINNY